MKWPLLACALAVGIGIGAGVGFRVEAQAPTARTAPRYQIVANDSIASTLLDTDTGRTWTRVKFAEFAGDPVVWIYQERLDTLNAVIEWGKYQPKKP